ncbi:MAG: ATP-binding protein [Bacteroidetes bacterium]|nr:ATP-binding protein [Bacteroidota bacterium]
MLLKRTVEKEILRKLKTQNKVIIIYGARQVGKTTLVEQIIRLRKFKKVLKINADQQKHIDIFSKRDFSAMEKIVHGNDLVFIDEAQRIPEIGINLKILTDNLPKLKIIATGSSSFDLANKLAEPLTGRKWTFTLFPFSISELSGFLNKFEIIQKLEDLLIFGLYPEVILTKSVSQKISLLEELNGSYLYKDIFYLANIKQTTKLRDLLKLLAFQIGQEVSVHELSNSLGISRETVDRYIDLLEKSFVLFRQPSFSRNPRNEITKMNKIYFWDIGIRNAVIDNFKGLSDRSDTGQLWENFLIAERYKFLHNKGINHYGYFWRTYSGVEIDYVEQIKGKLYVYEFKFSKTKAKIPQSWKEKYPDSKFKLINKDNFMDILF